MSVPRYPTPASAAAAARTRLEQTKSGNGALSGREWEITRLVADGLSNKQVGQRLKIAEGTVKIHLCNIFKKAGVCNRTALAAYSRSNSSYTNGL